MMSREKLLTLRKRVKAGEALERDQALAVIDHGVVAYVRGAELATREQQVRLALADLREVLTLSPRTPRPRVDAARARFILDLIDEMLGAEGPAWHRQWSWYTARVDEEFTP